MARTYWEILKNSGMITNFLATPMDYTHFTHFQRGIWDPDKKLCGGFLRN